MKTNDVENIKMKKKTYAHEMVREESPGELWDLKRKARELRENPYKTPPNNLTTKQKD